MEAASLKKSHKLLREWSYTWTPLDKGYTDKILYLNLSENEIKEVLLKY